MVDEAGMVASKDMAELIDLARSKNARIVFSGDTAQIKAVSEGDALRVLERESKIKSVSLVQVQRQLTQEYKAAVETLRYSPQAGYEQLEAMGAIRETDWRLRGQEVAQVYRQASAVPNIKGEARSVLVIAPTHDEIKSITYAIRQDRKRAGELSDGATFTRHVNLNWTEAQKRRVKNYKAGQILEFHRAVKGVARHESLEVVSVDKRSGVVARDSNGKTVTLSQKQAGAYHVYEWEAIEVSAGDKLLLQANRRTRGFKATNGELVTVAGVSQDGITLEDGRRLPKEYRQFAHGYAVTAHRSQGKTVDYEIIAAERMSHDLFYVSATRAREGLTVVTSDSFTLRESIGVSGDRQSATELSQRSAVAKPRVAISADELFRLYQQQQIDRSQHQRQQAIRIPEIGYNNNVTSTISF
jgi:ATP-dependent exoDNAse (exonuclease V) alpha subunit